MCGFCSSIVNRTRGTHFFDDDRNEGRKNTEETSLGRVCEGAASSQACMVYILYVEKAFIVLKHFV